MLFYGKKRQLPHDNAVLRKIRELVADLQRAGFTRIAGGGKGSHRKFVHPRFRGFVLLSGPNGGDAQPYQNGVRP